jgi:ATP-dependent helicase/nuclease subunit B
MPIPETELNPGPELVGWLAEKVRSRSSPLDPLTLIVPNHYLGIHLRRELAGTGFANVRSTVLARLAESLGAGRLAGLGWRPLTESQDQAAVRQAVGLAPGSLRAAPPHLALIRTLQRTFRTFREEELAPDLINHVASLGKMAESAVAAYRIYRGLLEQKHRYDRTDLYAAAVEAIAAHAGLLDEWGGLNAVFLSDRSAVESRFLQALGEHAPLTAINPPTNNVAVGLARGTPTVFIASAAGREVDAVVRDILAGLDRGLRLDRVAITYRDPNTYNGLVRDTLDRAGVPFSGLDGRPLSESLAGRSLLTLLQIREDNFARPRVVEWHGLLPDAPGSVPVGAWERLSRQAGVVSGSDQWDQRLLGLIDRLHVERAELESEEDASEARMRYFDRQIAMAARIRERISTLAAATEPPAVETWESLGDWCRRLLKEFVKPGHDWDKRESEAHQLIASELEGLASASEIETGVSIGTFLATLRDLLSSRRQTEGRFGVGVVVGSVRNISGMHFDHVYLLGMTEQSYPTSLPADPVMPLQEESNPLGLRKRHLARERGSFEMAMLCASPANVTLSFPLWDAGTRPVYPSSWLVEIAGTIEGSPLQAAELRDMSPRGWLVRVSEKPSTQPHSLNLADYRLRLAARSHPRMALATSPLALRTDLPLGSNLRTTDARRSDRLTEYDGCLAGAADTSAWIRSGLASRVASPTAVEKWATCPFSYFLERWLRVEPTELPEDVWQWSLSPLDRGSMMHAILERFFAALAVRGTFVPGYQYTVADHESIETMAIEAFAQMEADGKTGLSLAWENEKDVLLQELHVLLVRDQEERGSQLVPTDFEQVFGGSEVDSWPMVVVPLADGRTVQLRGRIDRVDIAGGRNPGHIRVIDYKTGSNRGGPREDDPLAAGTNLQLAAYGKAVSTWLESRGLSGVDIDAAYWYVSTKGKFEIAEQRIDVRLGELFDIAIGVIDDGITSGCFPQSPGDETVRSGRTSWDSCVYCAFDRICPAGRDQLAERKRNDGVAAAYARLAAELGQVDG